MQYFYAYIALAVSVLIGFIIENRKKDPVYLFAMSLVGVILFIGIYSY